MGETWILLFNEQRMLVCVRLNSQRNCVAVRDLELSVVDGVVVVFTRTFH
jgi:hypothetical protein